MQRRITFMVHGEGKMTFQSIGENGERTEVSHPFENFTDLKAGAREAFPEDELSFERVILHD